RTDPNGLYAYPDLTVVCGEPAFHDARQDVLLNPVVIVEVLSPSTEACDRGKKFALYRRIESLADYLLVSQEEPGIEHYARQPDDRWLLTPAEGLEASVYIASIDCPLALADVYDKVF
ncbi:MAG: Uma2 family endonuclease, partial [Armatimonadetes bacterium]|nr:Uma2 family endonuclease [Armatimonadota bacterium]